MMERKKKPIPANQRDFELAKRIDARANPMGAMARMNDSSLISRVMHSGMSKRVKHEDNAISMPTKHVMAVSRRPLPAPVKKEVKERDIERELRVKTRQLEINEQEREELKKQVEV
jgi:hypothetical protein